MLQSIKESFTGELVPEHWSFELSDDRFLILEKLIDFICFCV
jgi:hypothetical protein